MRYQCAPVIMMVVLLTSCHASRAGVFGRPGTVKIRVRTPEERGRLLNQGGQVVAEYGGFSVLEAPASAVRANSETEEMPDDNSVLLNAGPLDTRLPHIRQ